MLRLLHKYPGLIAGILVMTLALSGSILSVMPTLERLGVTPAAPNQTVSDLVGQILPNYPGLEQIVRKPSGKIIAYYSDNDTPGADIVNPATGKKTGNYVPSAFRRWVTQLHRAFLFDNKGRIAAGISASFMFLLTASGLWLLTRRMGGLRRIFGRVRGTRSQRLHVQIGRYAIFGLAFSSMTAMYLSLTTFGFISDGWDNTPLFPADVNGGPTMAADKIPALKTIPVSELHTFTFPYPGDPTDVFSINLSTGSGYIDQATGEMLTFVNHNTAQTVYEWIYMLHTGKGLWWLGLILGACALAGPFMGVTGTLIWWHRRRSQPKLKHNLAPQAADTIILVGSQGNATWGFAKTLHDGLNAAGYKVHTAPMNRLASAYKNAERMFILSATYGDGEAPESAKTFLSRLSSVKQTPEFPVAVLGFGDRQFPQFCRFSQDVSDALTEKGWKTLMPFDRIDRQSAQEFARWGRDLSAVLGKELELLYTPMRRPTQKLTLISRDDYGTEVQAPTTVFRFNLPRRSLVQRLFGRGFPGFRAGDLVGVLPPKSDLPRYYSLASCTRENQLEICVRKQPGGLCSNFLHGLQPGEGIDAFIQPNPDFRPARGRAPVILIGAGTGIGPLAGFIRGNRTKRPMHLYFGARDPRSDYLYQGEIEAWQQDKRLQTVTTAFSRVSDRHYVQDKIAADGEKLQYLINSGAQILICGGRRMAESVADALEEVLAPMNMDVARLKATGKYVEDVY